MMGYKKQECKDKIYLCQTDTTAGFLSKDLKVLNTLKQRPLDQPCLVSISKFSVLKELVRVPRRFKNLVRRSQKTTFIYPNTKSIRVVRGCEHSRFLEKMVWMYSTSANVHGKKFDEIWAKSAVDEVIGDHFYEGNPSKIFRISQAKMQKIR